MAIELTPEEAAPIETAKAVIRLAIAFVLDRAGRLAPDALGDIANERDILAEDVDAAFSAAFRRLLVTYPDGDPFRREIERVLNSHVAEIRDEAVARSAEVRRRIRGE